MIKRKKDQKKGDDEDKSETGKKDKDKKKHKVAVMGKSSKSESVDNPSEPTNGKSSKSKKPADDGNGKEANPLGEEPAVTASTGKKKNGQEENKRKELNEFYGCKSIWRRGKSIRR